MIPLPEERVSKLERWRRSHFKGVTPAAVANVINKLLPNVFPNTEQHANNRVECDHERLKARLGPMRGLKTDRGARVAILGQMFIQDLRRGHYELGAESTSDHRRVAAAFDELALTS